MKPTRILESPAGYDSLRFQYEPENLGFNFISTLVRLTELIAIKLVQLVIAFAKNKLMFRKLKKVVLNILYGETKYEKENINIRF